MTANSVKELATKLVDEELKSLRQTFINFTQHALLCDELQKLGAIDVRVVMEKVLKGLITANGSETPSTINDTHPREGILMLVEQSMIDNEELNADQLDSQLDDLDDFPLYQKLKENKRESWVSSAAQSYVRAKKIATTRAFEQENRERIINFLKSFVNQNFDQLNAVQFTDSDEAQIDQLIDAEVAKAI